MAIQKFYNGCVPTNHQEAPSVAMEVAGAEAMLGFNPRSTYDGFPNFGESDYGEEFDYDEEDVF